MTEAERIVAEARQWIGTPVRWEARLKGIGCDCRGLVAGVAHALGRPEARELEACVVGYAGRIDERQLLTGLDRLFDRVEGAPIASDVLALRLGRKVQHLAICSGDRGRGLEMIHAYLSEPARVCEVPIGSHWGRRLAAVYRWKELA
jgi:NlpC/P60 family putative phage cell wall peptidase